MALLDHHEGCLLSPCFVTCASAWHDNVNPPKKTIKWVESIVKVVSSLDESATTGMFSMLLQTDSRKNQLDVQGWCVLLHVLKASVLVSQGFIFVPWKCFPTIGLQQTNLDLESPKP